MESGQHGSRTRAVRKPAYGKHLARSLSIARLQRIRRVHMAGSFESTIPLRIIAEARDSAFAFVNVARNIVRSQQSPGQQRRSHQPSHGADILSDIVSSA